MFPKKISSLILKKKRLKWVNDSSNDTDYYARNRVRSHILPAIKEEINPGAEAGIRRAGYLAGMADVYLKNRQISGCKNM